jgi:hypothetical protein
MAVAVAAALTVAASTRKKAASKAKIPLQETHVASGNNIA